NYNDARNYYLDGVAAYSGFLPINDFAWMCMHYGGFYWGACTEKANLFTAILYRIGIPETRCAVMIIKTMVEISHHYVPVVYVYDHWLYLDPAELYSSATFEEPQSIPYSHPWDFTHPYEIYSPYNSVPDVPLIYRSVKDPVPSPYLPFEIDIDTSIFAGEGVTVHFSNLISEGATNVEVVEGSPSPNFQLVPEDMVYEITTTSTFDGPIIISLQYNEEDLVGNEAELELMHWDETENNWLPITTWVDTENNIIYGETYHFSLFGILVPRTTRELKQDAIVDLESAKTGDKGTDNQLECIIKHIEKSLEDELWVDEKYIDPKIGMKVFAQELSAVAKLMELSETSELDLEPALKKLAMSDSWLAKNALEEVESLPVPPNKNLDKVEQLLTKARDQIIEGDKYFEDENYIHAINSYKSAWGHTRLALKFLS
ncbi:MAG: hypothetical protein KAJ51_07280, partial [Thermoplasmata archaeon]|nr:hypothetical protein [Thermoplasmata archaeon]